MRARRPRLSIPAVILMAVATAACSMGGAIFTEEELDAMYSISVSSDGTPLAAGARVSASSPLDISVTGIDGAPEAVLLEVRLSYPDGTEAAAIAFASSGAAAPDARSVRSFEDDVPPFTVPADLPDGYYTLVARIKNTQGSTLSTYSTAVLIYTGELPMPRLAVYPGVVAAGGVSLLMLEGDYPEGLDPWIRWTVDGSIRSVGFLSGYADRLAWQAPAASGVYLAKAELYPFQPPTGYDIAPLAKADIRLPLSGGPSPEDPLASSATWSRLTFDGDFVDKGARERSGEPAATGSPRLETYSSGFGYLLGAGAGAASASSLVPTRASDGRLEPFSAVFTLASPRPAAEPGSGVLLSVSGYDADAGFAIGVRSGIPYLASGDATVSAAEGLPAGLTRLAVYAEPAGNGAFVQFYIDERPAGGGVLDAELFAARPGASSVAGPDGYVAVYDELRVIAGPYPAFRLAEREPEARGSDLIAATGFEGGSLGPGFATEGEAVELSHGKLVLGAGSRLLVGTGGQPAQGSSLSFRLLEGRAAASLELDSGALLVIGSDGTVSLDDQDTNLRVSFDPAQDSPVSVSVVPAKDGILVYGYDDAPITVKNSSPAAEARWALSPAGDASVAVTEVSLSVFSAPLAAARDGTRVTEGPVTNKYTPGSVRPQEPGAQGGRAVATLGL